jgi:fructose-bisphosphate aldolase class II
MLYNMKELLAVANENFFAVPAFNVSDYGMFEGIMQTAEETNSPVIIEIHPLELDFVGTDLCKAILFRAHASRVPVVLHLDHCNDTGKIVQAIQAGFTSIMYDGSALPYEENVAGTKRIIELAHPANVSVEAELGTIGSTAAQRANEDNTIIYTRPEDAADFAKRTGVDSLAVAIGTSHGIYPQGMIPKLRLDILQEIKAQAGIPLVLHGGSGNSDEEVEEAVNRGINKINIASDIKNAYYKKMREMLQDPLILEPLLIQTPCIEAMQQVVRRKMELCHVLGKAELYR